MSQQEEIVEKKQTQPIHSGRVHQGANVEIVRTLFSYNQKGFGEMLGYTQKQISRIESQEIVEEEFLNKLNEVFKVDINWVKTFSKEVISSFNQSVLSVSPNGKGTMENTNNYIAGDYHDKKNVTLREVKKGYERLIEEKDIRIEELKARVEELEKKEQSEETK